MKLKRSHIAALALSLACCTDQALARPRDPYAEGMRAVQQAISAGDLPRADATLARLAKRYPGNAEVLSARARVLFWQKRYAESIALFSSVERLKPSAEIRREKESVQTAQLLAEADSLSAAGRDEAARTILAPLFEQGRDPYDSGLRLARLLLRTKDFSAAVDVLYRMLAVYPDDKDLVHLKAQALLAQPDPQQTLAFLETRTETPQDPQLLALKGRALMRLKRYPEAQQAFAASLALAEDQEVRQERDRAELAALLERSDQLIAKGSTGEAGAVLNTLFQGGRDRYGTGTRLAAMATRSGDHGEAARIYRELLSDYPNDPDFPLLYAQSLVNLRQNDAALAVLNKVPSLGTDSRLLAMRGRIYYLQGKYPFALEEYDRALQLAATPELVAQRREVADALRYQQARALVTNGEFAQAQPLLQDDTSRDARLLLGRVLIAQHQYPAALTHSRALYQQSSDDPEAAVLYAEALMLNGLGTQGEETLSALPAPARETFMREREDLFYLSLDNWLKVTGAGYSYSNGSGSETAAGISVAQRVKGVKVVATASGTTRFHATDPQLILDLYFPRGERAKVSGAVYLSTSPGSRFLPRYSAGGEIGYAFPQLDVSGGYNRLQFRNVSADVLTAAGTWYIPRTSLSLSERIYLVPRNGSVVAVTMLRWDASHRLSSFIALGGGNSSERKEESQDVQRYATYSARGGGEYRFASSYSVGAEVSFESRRELYDRVGGAAFIRYWWR